MFKKRQWILGVAIAAVMVISWTPAQAGSAAIGSVAGSENATLSGQALAPNTTVFSGDSLEVQKGLAVVAIGQGGRMVFGQDTRASFLREAKDVTVLLGGGQVSLYEPAGVTNVRVKAGAVTVSPAAGYKTLGEVAMRNGQLMVTAKQGLLNVEGQGRTEQVAQGKSITLPVETARAPMPDPPGEGGSNAHITTSTTLQVLTFGSATAAAILAGLDLSHSNNATNAANNALNAANNANTNATNAANAANAAGCAIDAANPNASPSPYVPPAGFSCQ